MGSTNPFNVYRGPDSIRNYFDPDSSPPLPLVEIPECLNPFRQDGVRIYAKMMTMHPANNVKSMPALNLLENSVKPGKTKTIVEYSSGSTVLSMSLIARALYGISDVRAYLSNKTSMSKLRLMQFFGIKMSNWKAHVRWTGPQILSQLPEINVVCAGMGTSGSMTGLGTYFKDTKPSVFRLGVCTAAGDRVPGPRSYALLAPVEFPWKSSVDHIEEVASRESFSLSLNLCRQGIICGPSSGFNLQGLFQFIQNRKNHGSLAELAGSDGEVHCVFICCDLPYQYITEYFDKLAGDQFPSVKNEALLKVDLHRYDEKWEREAFDALGEYLGLDEAALGSMLSYAAKPGSVNNGAWETLAWPKSGTAILDIRQAVDYIDFHLPGSINVPFVHEADSSPFSDPQVLESLWQRLEEIFLVPGLGLQAFTDAEKVLIVCYDGDSSRVATSVLRARGYEADSIKLGFHALRELASNSTCGLIEEGTDNDKTWVRAGGDVVEVEQA
ncbi:hypothetical protein G7046_g703 [Stylonectria norvegica]|nr:hypothetical protein G7046_g703 [Stylonectria norvegica]